MIRIRDNLLLIGVIVLLLGIGTLGIVGAYKSPSTQQQEQSYSPEDTERPQIELSEDAFDLGTMGVNEIRTREIVVTNTGSKPLTLKKFTTSCDCTFAHMTIDGKESPHFTMHGMNMWEGTIEPGNTGTLTVIYEPARMPVQGTVERAVLFETNDPANPRVTVSFTATVN